MPCSFYFWHLEYWIHTDCFAAMQLSQSCKHSESTDLLRKSLLPHVFTVSKFSHLACWQNTGYIRIAPLPCSSRNPANIRNPQIYCVNCCFLMFLRFPNSVILSCEQERCLYLETYVSSIPYGIGKCKVEFVKMHTGFFLFRRRYAILNGKKRVTDLSFSAGITTARKAGEVYVFNDR